MATNASNERPRSRVGRAVRHPDGTTSCRLRIPLGHPAATFIDENGTRLEVEHEREFAAGPGVTGLRAIDPITHETALVGGNLLPVSGSNPLIHVGASNLASFLRRAARRFDAEARAGGR